MTALPRLAARIAIAAATTLLANSPGWAAPGEDPVTITGRVTYLQLPLPPVTRSGDIVFRQGRPDYMRAKRAGYTAQAYSSHIGDIKTDKDVVNVNRTQAGQTTCIQTIASTTAAPGTRTPLSNDQIVVIRGDLINLCN